MILVRIDTSIEISSRSYIHHTIIDRTIGNTFFREIRRPRITMLTSEIELHQYLRGNIDTKYNTEKQKKPENAHRHKNFGENED